MMTQSRKKFDFVPQEKKKKKKKIYETFQVKHSLKGKKERKRYF